VTYFEVLKATESRIRRTDAVTLLSFVTKLSVAELVRDYGDICGEDVIAKLEPLVLRAVNGEPVAYITGECEFCGLSFRVTPDVLIPRPDSEPLVDAAVEFAKARRGEKITVLDLCCGSGCLGLAAITFILDSYLIALDISEKSLQITRSNAEILGLAERLTLIQEDVFNLSGISAAKADVIISNPPYVTADEMLKLDHSVRDYEPHLALYGGTDGLDFYRAIAANAGRFLAPNGVLILECGAAQESAVKELTESIANCIVIPTGTL
jgi:release factor glutamine methyltransferase